MYKYFAPPRVCMHVTHVCLMPPAGIYQIPWNSGSEFMESCQPACMSENQSSLLKKQDTYMLSHCSNPKTEH